MTLAPLLSRLAQRQALTRFDRDVLEASLNHPLETGWAGDWSPSERVALISAVGPEIEREWRDRTSTAVPWDDLWHVHIPLALTLAARARQTGKTFFVGVNGTIGQGKTTFCRLLTTLLNSALGDGQAVSVSLDDYYWPQAVRSSATFRAQGYDPEGIPNRGPAGTHEIARLLADMDAAANSSEGSLLRLPVFSKEKDDREKIPREIRGRVALFLLEGWFVGSAVPAQPVPTAAGLAHAVATALLYYAAVWRRLDALWAFEPAPLDQILQQRLGQEEHSGMGLERRMSRVQIDRFVRYFYRDAWIPGSTTPTPPESDVTWWAALDPARRFVSVRRGGRGV